MTAPTATPQALADEFRADLLALRAAVVYETLRYWPLLSADDVDGTAPGWLDIMLDLVTTTSRAGAWRAIRFYDAYRRATVGEGITEADFTWDELDDAPREDVPRVDFGRLRRLLAAADAAPDGRTPEQDTQVDLDNPPDASRFAGFHRLITVARRASTGAAPDREPDGEVVDVPHASELLAQTPTFSEQIVRALTHTGPAGLQRRLERQWAASDAKRTALVEVAGAASRLAMEPAREQVPSVGALDQYAVGFARKTGPRPCYFCAAMASRGPVYYSRETAGARNRTSPRRKGPGRTFVGLGAYTFHDHCMCTVVPLFSDDEEWPDRAREFEALWAESTAEYSGQAKMRAFRRAYQRTYGRWTEDV